MSVASGRHVVSAFQTHTAGVQIQFDQQSGKGRTGPSERYRLRLAMNPHGGQAQCDVKDHPTAKKSSKISRQEPVKIF